MNLWQYDPSVDQWLQKSNFPVGPRLLTNSFSISNKGYLYSGWDPDSGVSVNDFWEYDPANDIWNQKATPPGPGRVGSIASGGNLFGYAGLGSEIAASQFDDIYEYDQQNNSWATIINPFGFRSGTIDFVYNDHLYVGGGFLRFSGTEYIAQYDLREYTPQFINSVNELTLSKSVSVYPVPTLNDIIVMSDEEITFIEIFDVMGQVKYRRKKNEGSKLNLNVDFLTAGIYFIRCNSNNKVVRFVKE